MSRRPNLLIDSNRPAIKLTANSNSKTLRHLPLTIARRGVRGFYHGNFPLAAQTKSQPDCYVFEKRLAYLHQGHASSCQRHTGAGTPLSSDGVAVIHAADASLSVTSSRRPTGKGHHAWSWARSVWWQPWRCRRSKAMTMRLLTLTETTRACHLMPQWWPTWQPEPWLEYWSTRWCTPWTLSR